MAHHKDSIQLELFSDELLRPCDRHELRRLSELQSLSTKVGGYRSSRIASDSGRSATAGRGSFSAPFLDALLREAFGDKAVVDVLIPRYAP